MTFYFWFHLDHPFHLLTFSNPKYMILSLSHYFPLIVATLFFSLSISSFFFTILPPKHSFSFIFNFLFSFLILHPSYPFCHFLLPSFPPMLSTSTPSLYALLWSSPFLPPSFSFFVPTVHPLSQLCHQLDFF